MTRLHVFHPRIRAEEWRSPLVRRLLVSTGYADGSRELVDSFRAEASLPYDGTVFLRWEGLLDDFERCIRTYQEPRLTEFATLGLACILLTHRASLEITEVTRFGERVDYWIGTREYVLEVSGQRAGNLESLYREKAAQLRDSPLERDGYVCVANYASMQARLWFVPFRDDR